MFGNTNLNFLIGYEGRLKSLGWFSKCSILLSVAQAQACCLAFVKGQLIFLVDVLRTFQG